MNTTRITYLICLLTLVACGTALAQDKVKNQGKSGAITSGERDAIRAYCVHFEQRGKKGKKAKSLPPGLAKKVARGGRLPPGWEKKLVIGEIVPEPVFKECHPLPPEIVIKLPAPPPGTILRAIEGRILRLHEKTLEILDVFDPFH